MTRVFYKHKSDYKEDKKPGLYAKLISLEIPTIVIFIACMFMFYGTLFILDAYKARQISITNTNVAHIVLTWHAKNTALAYFIYLLFIALIWKMNYISYTKKPQGPLRGVK